MVRSHTEEKKSDFLKNEHSLYVASELAEHYQMFCFRKKKTTQDVFYDPKKGYITYFWKWMNVFIETRDFYYSEN